MRLFRTCYRKYTWRWWKDAFHLPLDFLRFLGRVYRYREFLWNDVDWDWSPLAEIMQMKLEAMGEHFRRHDNVTRSDEMARQCLTAASLLKRLREDDYAEVAGYSPEPLEWEEREDGFWRMVSHPNDKNLRAIRHGHIMAKNDQEYLFGTIFRKYFRHWWD